MSSDLNTKDKELYRVTDEILHYVWDPIGVSRFPEARDEYCTYLDQTFGLLKKGATQEAIAEYLGKVTTVRMGLTASPENDLNSAGLLCEWRKVINEKFA